MAHASEPVQDELPRTAPPDLSGPEQRLAFAALRTRTQEMERILRGTTEALVSPHELVHPGSPLFRHISRNAVPRWHFAMLNDTQRNAALSEALLRQVPQGAVVLDVGTGTGLLAMAAVRAGASHVYTCEENPLLAEIARQIIAEHDMSSVITVFDTRSTGLRVGHELERPVDMLVSEIVDCGLIGEGLLPTVRHAREHLLAPDGGMVPVAARLWGQLVHSDAISNLNRVHTADGRNVSLMNVAATQGHFPVRLSTWPHRLLSEPVELAHFDLRHDSLLPDGRDLAVPVTAPGEAQALVAWFEMDLGSGLLLENSPRDTASHWMQAFIPFDKPTAVVTGDRLDVRVNWTDEHLIAS